jgi:hypothetical protein
MHTNGIDEDSIRSNSKHQCLAFLCICVLVRHATEWRRKSLEGLVTNLSQSSGHIVVQMCIHPQT